MASKRDGAGKMVLEAIDSLERRFGKGAVMRLGEGSGLEVATFSSGVLSIDLALGCGGWPKGRIVEVFGPESSGKTTLTLQAIAAMQRSGGVAAFVDAEHALDPQYAAALGVDLNALLVAQPDSGEQALEIVEALVRSSAVDLVVVDSVAALVPESELRGDMGDAHMGVQARLMSQALRKLTGVVNRTETTVIFINQVRQKIGVTFGNGEVTTGGNALKFYSSIRVDIRRIGAIKHRDEVVGAKTRIRVVKNKLAPPFRFVETEIRYGVGICPVSDLMQLAEEMGMMTRSGSWYSIGDERVGQGRESVRQTLLEDQTRRDALMALVRERANAPISAQAA